LPHRRPRRHALDCGADGVVILASNQGTYLGSADQDELFAPSMNAGAVVFVHPADLPGPVVDGIAPFAADFLQTRPAPPTCWCVTASCAAIPVSGSS
jgi:hypothetical protein